MKEIHFAAACFTLDGGFGCVPEGDQFRMQRKKLADTLATGLLKKEDIFTVTKTETGREWRAEVLILSRAEYNKMVETILQSLREGKPLPMIGGVYALQKGGE